MPFYWIGALLGAVLGGLRGGIFGLIIGVFIGALIENKIRGGGFAYNLARKLAREFGGGVSGEGLAGRNELKVLAAISAMMAKMAKADGRITADEVRYCERVFDRLGLQGAKRAYCINVFRKAKDDRHSIYEYAESFSVEQRDLSVREIVYDILWDVACADGEASLNELYALKQLTSYLGINPALFEWQASRRRVRRGDTGNGAEAADAYAELGVARAASDEEVKRAYREKAKALHPDVLRAQGLSEELLGRANERMARINAAWSQIRRERGI